ncbi:UPF0398 protein [Anopheles sinensis]|uniref:UPF0398 protein n=1 Tax=Anopheles sinensis TaxID=74873 RepID=A0A084VA72_ANOSI|nr:UPF0398 protein [Anopheles sinensis]
MEERQDPEGDVKEALTSGHSSSAEDIGLKWLALNGSELGAEYQQVSTLDNLKSDVGVPQIARNFVENSNNPFENHLGALEQTELLANMSNGTSAAIEEINTYYFYELQFLRGPTEGKRF